MKELVDYLESLDRQLFLLINGLHSPFIDKLMLAFSDARFWIPLFIWLLFVLYKAYPGKQMLWVLLAVGVSITLTDRLSVDAFKNIFMRYRPCYNTEIQSMIHLVKDSCGGRFGFVSSHAANFAGLAMLFTKLLKFEYRNIGWVLAIWVALIGYSRIYLGVHYPADVIGGIVLGSVVGWLVYKSVSKVIDV
jgi:undecaprenyl-diphosphatase